MGYLKMQGKYNDYQLFYSLVQLYEVKNNTSKLQDSSDDEDLKAAINFSTLNFIDVSSKEPYKNQNQFSI